MATPEVTNPVDIDTNSESDSDPINIMTDHSSAYGSETSSYSSIDDASNYNALYKKEDEDANFFKDISKHTADGLEYMVLMTTCLDALKAKDEIVCKRNERISILDARRNIISYTNR